MPQHKCVKVPVEKCKVVKVEVPKEMCETRDMEKCFKVPTQSCQGMTRQDTDTESRLLGIITVSGFCKKAPRLINGRSKRDS